MDIILITGPDPCLYLCQTNEPRFKTKRGGVV